MFHNQRLDGKANKLFEPSVILVITIGILVQISRYLALPRNL